MENINMKHNSVLAWLQDIESRNTTDKDDEAIVAYTMKLLGIDYRAVTCGLVYVEGIGAPVSLQVFAQQALSALREKGVIA